MGLLMAKRTKVQFKEKSERPETKQRQFEMTIIEDHRANRNTRIGDCGRGLGTGESPPVPRDDMSDALCTDVP
jgi:hypothetical protein